MGNIKMLALLGLSMITAFPKAYMSATTGAAAKYTMDIGGDTIHDGDECWVEHESLPEFPGGLFALRSYVYDNLRYPEEAYNDNVQGVVLVGFHIDKTGVVHSVKVVKSVDARLDSEAVRVVESMPVFIPGKWDGIPIDKWLALPVRFKISGYTERKNKRYPAFQYDNGDDYVKDGLYRSTATPQAGHVPASTRGNSR